MAAPGCRASILQQPDFALTAYEGRRPSRYNLIRLDCSAAINTEADVCKHLLSSKPAINPHCGATPASFRATAPDCRRKPAPSCHLLALGLGANRNTYPSRIARLPEDQAARRAARRNRSGNVRSLPSQRASTRLLRFRTGYAVIRGRKKIARGRSHRHAQRRRRFRACSRGRGPSSSQSVWQLG